MTMSAFNQEPLPVRLYQENPNGPVSLLDMLRFYAHNFVAAFGTLGQAMMEIRSGHTSPSSRTLGAVGASLGMLLKQCQELELKFSAVHLKRLAESDELRTLPKMLKALEETQQRIWDELNERTYVQIPVGSAMYYEPSTPPFGQKVFDQFSSAIDDVREAGNCLALERSTAVVFHLMRVMEAGLKVLAKELGIAYAPSWESYLKQIAIAVEGDWKSKTAAEKARQPLYKELAGDLHAVKIAWRNPTMHIVKKYTPDEAMQVYNCVRQFMQRLAGADFSE